MTRRRSRELAALADGQWGVVGLGQLRQLGVADATVREWVARGRLVRLHSGVFAVGHRLLRGEGHYMAAVLACGPGAVLSYASAGALLGLLSPGAGRIDVTSPIRTGRRKPSLRIHRGDRLLEDEVTALDGIPCTTAARTILDLASVQSQRGIESTIEAAERLALLDLRELATLIGRHRGRRGVARLKLALSAFDDEILNTRSELEARFFRMVADRGLPRPLVNGVIETSGGRFEVDFHWPRRRLVVETDGRAYHETTAAKERDSKRDRLLAEAGWTVIRCEWHDVVVNPIPLHTKLTGHFR